MHEVHLHRIGLAVDLMLARAMEMELHELELAAGSGKLGAIPDIHLDGVPIVDDGVGASRPADLERRELRLDAIPDIYRRLLAADRADAVRRVEVAPFV